MGSRKKTTKYQRIDREMKKAFREWDEISNTPAAEYTYVPGTYSKFRDEVYNEIVFRLKAANRKWSRMK